LIGDGGRYATLAIALPDELITELSRLRWLFVTARASSFRLRVSDTALSEIGRLLRARYCLAGTVEVSDRRVVVAVELIDTGSGGIIWADRISGQIDDIHAMRENIRSRVLTALEIQIPVHEATRARLVAVETLDAWAAYHLGLQHMYRFNRVDNAAAATLFHQAVALDPLFARAHAGLSFIHFQTAFMRYTNDITAEANDARRFAERGLELDPLDPFVNFTMGRTFWLTGDLDNSLGWLERATSISPHYAQGIYARAFTETLAARPQEGQRHVDLAMRLSPIDPLLYGMLGIRAFTHMALGEDGEAAVWAERAARSPGAHVLIAMIAAAAHGLNRDMVRAAHWAANVRERNSSLTPEDFTRAFPMKSDVMRLRVMKVFGQLGF
jgi:TolB-like protein